MEARCWINASQCVELCHLSVDFDLPQMDATDCNFIPRRMLASRGGNFPWTSNFMSLMCIPSANNIFNPFLQLRMEEVE